MAWVKRLWRAVQVRRQERQLRWELPDLDEAIDAADPAEVEQVARYLWVATCLSRLSTDPDDYALAAVIWLNYGLIRLPARSRPLDLEDLRGIPLLPYQFRTDVTS